MNSSSLIFCVCLLFLAIPAHAAESDSAQLEGIKSMRLVCDRDAIVPGDSFSIGLMIQHLPKYHTYWKAPGIVGIPTSITWELPNGFTTDQMEWPVPERTKMAAYTAYGYERDVYLLTKITASGELSGDRIKIKAKVAFMCCAKTCHPGFHDFDMTLPISSDSKAVIDDKWQKEFSKVRADRAPDAPKDWEISVSEAEDAFTLSLAASRVSFTKADDIYCFAEISGIDSDKQQTVQWADDLSEITITLPKSGFGPDKTEQFSAVIFHDKGWPGIDSNWVRISVPVSSN